jgi:hypothetical protein
MKESGPDPGHFPGSVALVPGLVVPGLVNPGLVILASVGVP